MKTKLILRTTGLLILIASFIGLYSCSKMAHESLTKLQKEQQDTMTTIVTPIDDKNFSESDEDLLSVDYKEFYDQLAPYGEWIQVSAEDIGLKSKLTSTNNSSNNSFKFSNLLGVQDAYADAEMGMVFVWQPTPDLTVAASIGDESGYRPYSDGRWENTDEGWYFRGRTPYEETVSHQGRWVHSHHGWLWVPGRVWAPAWVDWRENDDYVSWAPIPPSIYFNDGNISVSLMDDDDYMIVDRRHFCDPDIYRYYNPYYNDGSRISVSLMTGTLGLTISNNMIINRGPDVNVIQNFYGGNIEKINIHHVNNFKDVRYSKNDYNVYSPNFNRFNNKENKNFTKNQPKSFKNYNDLPERKSAGQNNTKLQKSNDSWYKQKINDNTKQNVSKDNSKQNVSKQNSKQNVSKQDTKQNVSKQNTKQNVSKQNTKQNVSKQNTKQNVSKQNTKQNVSKDNGNKQSGNTNGKQKK